MSMLIRALVTATALTAIAAISFASTADAQVIDFSKYPDFSGQWKRPAGVGVQWDQTKPLGKQQAPLTPEYQARYEANLKDQAAGGQGDDATGQCIPHGMPRVMTIVYPMEIIIMPKTTYILTDYTVPRRIFTDGRDWPNEVEPTFNGLSIGKWVDPDSSGRFSTLEVETRGFKNPRTYEQSGIRLHDDGQTVIKERIYLDKDKKDTLIDEITTIDNALTRPWTVTKKYVRETNPNIIWHFNDCAENNQHVYIGKEDYFVTADGLLMPVKKGQKAPDLRYFEQTQK
jgi:hypothetical protein